MAPVRIIVTGAAGRMGSRIIALAAAAGDLALAGAVERKGHTAVGRDAGEVAGVGSLGVPIGDDLSSVIRSGQVVIDFTTPEATREHLTAAARAAVAAVIGTTGLTPEDLARAREAAARIPLLISPNMSVGVNLLFRLLRETARALGEEYDVEIVEAHHHGKKDAPSGTALQMAEVIAAALGRDLARVGVYGRKGIVGERKREEIGIHTVRAGDIVGEHTVLFGGEGETITLAHRAHSRDTFARGALRAARWIVRQKPGLYAMQDVLGLA